MLPSAGVFHPRVGMTDSEPWQGRGPAQAASDTSRMAAGLEAMLADEAEAGSGYVVPSPAASKDTDERKSLKARVRALAGRVGLVPSMADTITRQGGTAQVAEWLQRRLGIDPPEATVELRRDVSRAMMMATGLHERMVSGQPDRETDRQYSARTWCYRPRSW